MRREWRERPVLLVRAFLLLTTTYPSFPGGIGMTMGSAEVERIEWLAGEDAAVRAAEVDDAIDDGW